MSKRRVLELQLDRVEVTDSLMGKKPTRHVLSVSLVWPRPAIAMRTAVKTVTMDDKVADLSGGTWTDRILFKETVQGPFGIEVTITEPLSEGQIGRIISLVGDAMASVAESEIADAAGNPLLARIVGLPFKRLTSAGKEQAKLFGSGALDLNPETRFKSGKRVTLNVPLTAPETLSRVIRKRKHGKLTSKRDVLLEAGAESGRVRLKARVYG